MADFNKAFAALPAARSGYRVDPEDGEMYCGIERRFYPSWDGWQIVDALKFAASDENEMKSTLEQNRKLRERVAAVFKHTCWDRFQGDRIPDQEVAEELLKSAVEMGVRRAVIDLQKVLNTLNPGFAARCRVIEDGRFGPETLRALEAFSGAKGTSGVVKGMRILQSLHYMGRIKKSSGTDRHAVEWFEKLVVAREEAPGKPAPPKHLRIED